MTDNYEFNRSMHKQFDEEYSPYNDKQWNNYINDINSGVYGSSGLSLIQVDLSSINLKRKEDLCEHLELYMRELDDTEPEGGYIENHLWIPVQ